MIEDQDFLKILDTEHEDSLPWLEKLPYDEEVELTVVAQPVFTSVHSAVPLRPGKPKDFVCRWLDDQACPICEGGGQDARQVAYCVVRKDGELYLWKATKSLVDLIELEAGLRFTVVKLDRRPHYKVGDSWTDLEAINDVFYDKLRTVVKKMASRDYYLRNGDGAIFEFFNRRPR